MAFSLPEYCRLFAQKKAYQEGVTGTPGHPPPLATPLYSRSKSVCFVSTRINKLSNSLKKNINYIRRAQRLIIVILWLFWNTWIARNRGIGKRKGVLQSWARNMAATDYILKWHSQFFLSWSNIFCMLIAFENDPERSKKNISCKHFKNTKENK